jgi:hypothetical protein
MGRGAELISRLPVGLVVATVAFLLMHLAPGNPASIIAGPDATSDDVRTVLDSTGRCRSNSCSGTDACSRATSAARSSFRKPVTEEWAPETSINRACIDFSTLTEAAGRRILVSAMPRRRKRGWRGQP